ncbi:MAG TPA: YtxH domain-containing protein [Saprospiraceae bacterium]|nr:YtxH domain-containing protein [Saprospiraceae bacterium]HPI05724.1 YtxH domain-containing protein [Saprospiraceae bacterium]
MSTESKIIVGFAAAALAGIGIGLLMAPYSGTESRDKLRKGTNDIANKLLDMVNTNGQALKEKAGDVVDHAKNAYNQVKGQAKSEVEDAKKELSRAV